MPVARARWWRFAAFLLCCFVAIAGVPWLVDAFDGPRVAPRQLARTIVQWSAGQNPAAARFGEAIGATLMRMDRGVAQTPEQSIFRIGAQVQTRHAQPTPPTPDRTIGDAVIVVASSAEAILALARANPGDVITFEPGVYRFSGSRIAVSRPGSAHQPIVVRADRAGTVTLEMTTVEGFLVSAPSWRFENLTITGVCADHSSCEHAFHIVGGATGFVARNNTISDFNAHFKINAIDDIAPDGGLIEANTLTNRSVRRTGNPVTPIDLVVASHWTIRKNLITDFIKGAGNRISYGAFAKGGGSDTVFENNIILCEHLLRTTGVQTVGLSLGGGGTGAQFCLDRRCDSEQDRGSIRGNLIASCSDSGIYLNKASNSNIVHNTLLDTGGIAVRFASSSALVEGNLVDGQIRSSEGATMRMVDNIDTSTLRLFLGSHPVMNLFDAQGLTVAGKDLPRRAAAGADVPDLCGAATGTSRVYGAFENFAGCRQSAPSVSSQRAAPRD